MDKNLFYEFIGWVALTLNIWGNLKLADKSISGWIIRLACNLTFIIYSAAFSVWPLLVNHIIFSFVNIYGWIKWHKNIEEDIYICSCGRKYNLEKYHNPNCICEMPIGINKN